VLIPICVLLDSNLDARSKLSVSVVMALGAVGSVSSIMRMVFLRGLILSPTSLSSMTIKATIWATAEPGTGIIAASIAILRPLIRDIKTSVKEHKGSRKGSRDEEDMVALTAQAAKKHSAYSLGDDELWSPTVGGKPTHLERVVIVQGGKGAVMTV
jgi:hypothetical protein